MTPQVWLYAEGTVWQYGHHTINEHIGIVYAALSAIVTLRNTPTYIR